MNNVSIIVSSWDGYKDIWPVFFKCFFKNWKDCPYPIYLGSNNSSYDDDRVKTIKYGLDIDYSSNLLLILENIPTEWIILWIEDLFLSETVKTIKISKIISDAITKNIDYLNLYVNKRSLIILSQDKKNTHYINKISKSCKYQTSITCGLWNKKFLEKILRKGESAWDFERKTPERIKKLHGKMYTLSGKYITSPPINVVHGVLRGKWTDKAIKYLKKEGLFKHTLKREKQSVALHVFSQMKYYFRFVIYLIYYKFMK